MIARLQLEPVELETEPAKKPAKRRTTEDKIREALEEANPGIRRVH
jgi:hypothetical protein